MTDTRVPTTVITPPGVPPATIVRTGPVGPASKVPGPPGDPARRFIHHQGQPASVWTVPHNLGARPLATILSPGGVVMVAAVVHLSENVLQVILDDPFSGQAICT